MSCAKEELLQHEGNDYFNRNIKVKGYLDVADGAKMVASFLKENGFDGQGKKVLEIGSCYGYNLAYISEECGTNCFGIDPSSDAVAYGNEQYASKGVKLIQGTSDELPYEDNFFDVVMVGFCWYWTDRNLILKCIAEADRVLKTGGILAIWDFDTKIPYLRRNSHNANTPTFKIDMAQMILSNPQYYLVEKKSYSHAGLSFTKDIQERLSLNIMYKEEIQNAYIYRD